jgi:hypothetical protein
MTDFKILALLVAAAFIVSSWFLVPALGFVLFVLWLEAGRP